MESINLNVKTQVKELDSELKESYVVMLSTELTHSS